MTRDEVHLWEELCPMEETPLEQADGGSAAGGRICTKAGERRKKQRVEKGRSCCTLTPISGDYPLHHRRDRGQRVAWGCGDEEGEGEVFGVKVSSLSFCSSYFFFDTGISNQKLVIISNKLSGFPWLKTVLAWDKCPPQENKMHFWVCKGGFGIIHFFNFPLFSDHKTLRLI